MTSFASATAFLLASVVVLHSSAATITQKSIDEFDLPLDKEWMSLSKTVDFIPASDQGSPLLRNAQKRLLNYYKEDFVDGLETQYNEYAQAWRYLGLFMDCDYVAQAQRRSLAADDGTVCKRYLLWAAYVDLDYSGNGLSEYMLYNTTSGSWDKSACKAAESKRCVKMDCHTQGTNFKTLGYFREDNAVEFLTVLAEHQGSCSFTDGEANAIADGAEWLPQDCTLTQVQVNSTYLYFDLKPKSGGAVDVALYTDAKCSMEYTGKDATAQDVLTSYYGYDVALQTNLANINAALDIFKVCTPCRTFDLAYQVPAATDDQAAQAADGSDPNNLNFVCDDEAGYAGVNQCMMFATNTEISAATTNEVKLASSQGTITRTYNALDTNQSWWDAWGFFTMSVITFIVGLVCFGSVAVKRKRISSANKNEPLIAKQ